MTNGFFTRFDRRRLLVLPFDDLLSGSEDVFESFGLVSFAFELVDLGSFDGVGLLLDLLLEFGEWLFFVLFEDAGLGATFFLVVFFAGALVFVEDFFVTFFFAAFFTTFFLVVFFAAGFLVTSVLAFFLATFLTTFLVVFFVVFLVDFLEADFFLEVFLAAGFVLARVAGDFLVVFLADFLVDFFVVFFFAGFFFAKPTHLYFDLSLLQSVGSVGPTVGAPEKKVKEECAEVP